VKAKFAAALDLQQRDGQSSDINESRRSKARLLRLHRLLHV
jgi:hypothetical protein